MSDVAPPQDRQDSAPFDRDANRRAPARPLKRVIGPQPVGPRAASGVDLYVDGALPPPPPGSVPQPQVDHTMNSTVAHGPETPVQICHRVEVRLDISPSERARRFAARNTRDPLPRVRPVAEEGLQMMCYRSRDSLIRKEALYESEELDTVTGGSRTRVRRV